MSRGFDPNQTKPNQPLRKPLSSPSPGATGHGSLNASPTLQQSLASGGSVPESNTVNFCTYCGQKGSLLCTRCKKTLYCSELCQVEDWNAHRHLCRSFEPDPAKENRVESTPVLPTGQAAQSGDRAGLVDSELAQPLTLQRVSLEDLPVTKVTKGANIQAAVVEFYSPGRFYILSQSQELMDALQNIGELLWRTYNVPSMSTYAPCVGEVCAVQYSRDQKWYRGLVKTLDTSEMVAHILYIDYGNEEGVQVDRIRALTPSLKTFSPCAMECRIARLVPVAGRWSEQCCLTVRHLLAGKSFTITVVDTLENGRVHTVDVLLPSGKQLSECLLEWNYAAEDETIKGPTTEQDISAIMNASRNNFERLSDGKDNNAWAQPPEPLTQAVGDSFTVVVTHLQSPSEMILQKVENAVVIQELQQKLREHCSRGPGPQNFRPAPGTVCCAQFSDDKQWYRAKVLAYPSEDRVCVGYLDFGNSEEVDLDHLQPIIPALLTLPAQAIRCGLAGVQPAGEAWSDNCVLALQRRVSNRILRIEILGAHEGKTLVAMTDEYSDPQANIAELLTSAGFSAPVPAPAPAPAPAPTPPPAPAPAPPPAPSSPPAALSSSVQQSDPKAAAAEEPQEPKASAEPLLWTYTELPTAGQMVALRPSILRNPHNFYCRLKNHTDQKRLIELGSELKLHCQANASSAFEPKVGEPCCALYPADGSWYRAMVHEVNMDDVAVVFVDYGNSLHLTKSHLKPITAPLLTLPFQAIHCRLAGVEPVGSEWSSGALLWFQTLMEEPTILARVLSVSQQTYSMEVQSKGEDVAAALISKQLAREAPGRAAPQVRDGEKAQGKMQSPMDAQSGARPREMATAVNAAPTEAQSFPLDWKTGELPLSSSFQPHVAAAISPALFYVFNQKLVDQVKLRALMEELAAHCGSSPASVSPSVLARARPGAACCAQFSADRRWYRAVILEVGESEMSVVYADYGNTEKVPFSRVRPIPEALLQLPFQIVRCTLSGKDQFPAEWPELVLPLFQRLLLKSVQATVESYDGSANVLSLVTLTERGRHPLASALLDELQAKSESSPPAAAATQRPKQRDIRTSPARALSLPTAGTRDVVTAISPTSPQRAAQPPQPSRATPPPPPPPAAAAAAGGTNDDPLQKIIEQIATPPKTPTKTNESQTSPCCCQSLRAKIDHLEQLMQLQISLLKRATKDSNIV